MIRACHDATGIAGAYVESKVVVGPGAGRRGAAHTPSGQQAQRSSGPGPGPVSRDLTGGRLRPLTSQTGDRPSGTGLWHDPTGCSRPGARQVDLMWQRRVLAKGTLPWHTTVRCRPLPSAYVPTQPEVLGMHSVARYFGIGPGAHYPLLCAHLLQQLDVASCGNRVDVPEFPLSQQAC